MSAAPKREQGASHFSPEIRDGILERDGRRCCMAGFRGCRGGAATEANHRLNRGAGGSRDAVVNSPANGCAAEHGCNWKLEAVEEFAEEGRRRGVKLELGADPERVPLWSPMYGQWLVLRGDGAHLTGIRDATLDARRADEWIPEEWR